MKNINKKIVDVIFWMLCILIIIISIIIMPYGIHSIMFLISAICICPLIINVISRKIKKINIPQRIFILIATIFLICATIMIPQQNVYKAFDNNINDSIKVNSNNVD